MNKILEKFIKAIECLCEETGLQSHRPYAHTTSDPDTIRSAAEELIKEAYQQGKDVEHLVHIKDGETAELIAKEAVQSERNRFRKIVEEVRKEWNGNGEYYNNVTIALSAVLKEIEE